MRIGVVKWFDLFENINYLVLKIKYYIWVWILFNYKKSVNEVLLGRWVIKLNYIYNLLYCL